MRHRPGEAVKPPPHQSAVCKFTLHQRRKRRRRVAEHHRERFHLTGPNQVWSMDFVADQLATEEGSVR
jgi:hypothetical protein